MYLDFYKLRELPFAITCDERFFYESAVHAEALANMMYTVQQRKGMVLVTGEVGAGKTFLGMMLGSRLGVGCLTAMVSHPPQSGKQLLRALAARAGMNVRATADKLALIEELEHHLFRLDNRDRIMALIVDEAQDLNASSLEEIRLLWNWERDSRRLVQIVLIGQPELRQRLLEPQWEPLRQRIVLTYHLGHLSAADTAAYIAHRLRKSTRPNRRPRRRPGGLNLRRPLPPRSRNRRPSRSAGTGTPASSWTGTRRNSSRTINAAAHWLKNTANCEPICSHSIKTSGSVFSSRRPSQRKARP